MNYECDFCGLSEFDLPDGIDPEFIFEPVHSGTACQGCALVEDAPYWFDLPDEEDEEWEP